MNRDPNYKWGVWVAKDELKEFLDASQDLISNYGAHEGSCTVNEEGYCPLHRDAMEQRETRVELALQSFSKIFEDQKQLQNQPNNVILETTGLGNEETETKPGA